MVSEHRRKPPALIAHIVFRFDYGGLENGVVNVINGLSDESFRHVVIALSEVTEFAHRLKEGVMVESIGKKPGKDPKAYLRLYRLLRHLKPDIVHTRNFGTLDCALIAYLARVPIRIHGEHGWDVFDPDGTKLKYRYFRRFISGFVDRFVTVSNDLRQWLVEVVGISTEKVQHICNGVNTERFQPKITGEPSPLPASLTDQDNVIIGSVTRFSAIKDPLNLVEAFIAFRRQKPTLGQRARLMMIGDGELHKKALALLNEAGLQNASWLPGSRDDIPELLRSMDLFVLGSLREGISNTILEAMASGLPVIATDTGGNVELIDAGSNGSLVPPGNREALTAAITEYVKDTDRRRDHGRASRDRAESRYSINRMIDEYRSLYESALSLQRT